jgi:hypothetical protein
MKRRSIPIVSYFPVVGPGRPNGKAHLLAPTELSLPTIQSLPTNVKAAIQRSAEGASQVQRVLGSAFERTLGRSFVSINW